MGVVQNFFVKNEKNLSCSKLPEMAGKLAVHDYLAPPPKNRVTKKKYVKDEKIKVVKHYLKWRENWVKIIFGFFRPPPKKGTYKIFVQKTNKHVVQNWHKWRENRSKRFLDAPPPKKIRVPKKIVKNEKNQSCSELPEMARKFDENNFLIF